LIPDVGATYFLPRIFNNNINVGLFYGLTGERLKGKDLVKCGLATHFVTQEKLDQLKQKILESVDENTNLQKMNQLCSSYSEIIFKEKDFSLNKLDEIINVFQLDSLSNVFSRLNEIVEKGEEENKNWAANILKNLNSYCPTSLVLHFEQMKRGIKIKSLEEAYDIELQLIRK
jgi:enoyl-CoA hydratase/carnithine racemase